MRWYACARITRASHPQGPWPKKVMKLAKISLLRCLRFSLYHRTIVSDAGWPAQRMTRIRLPNRSSGINPFGWRWDPKSSASTKRKRESPPSPFSFLSHSTNEKIRHLCATHLLLLHFFFCQRCFVSSTPRWPWDNFGNLILPPPYNQGRKNVPSQVMEAMISEYSNNGYCEHFRPSNALHPICKMASVLLRGKTIPYGKTKLHQTVWESFSFSTLVEIARVPVFHRLPQVSAYFRVCNFESKLSALFNAQKAG